MHAAGHDASVCRLPWPGNAGQLRAVVVSEFACDNAGCSSASHVQIVKTVRHCGSQHWRIRSASNIGVAQYQFARPIASFRCAPAMTVAAMMRINRGWFKNYVFKCVPTDSASVRRISTKLCRL